MTAGDDILEDLFHFCALRAYLEIAVASKQFPPDSDTTRRRANELYESALAEKNRHRQPHGSGHPPRREAGQGCEAPERDAFDLVPNESS
jgi:hypothetical protein